MPPTDQHAQHITHHLNTYDLDPLITTLHHLGLITNTTQHLSNLKPIFTAAQRDHINLLHPPPDYHPWLSRTLTTNADGTPAKPNTQNSRATSLRTLYRALRKLHLITGNPLLDFTTHPTQRRTDPLPSRTHLETLIHASRQDAALHAALLLLWHHAVPMATLIRQTWAAYNPHTARLLRGNVTTTLTPTAAAALDTLHHTAGYDPLYPDTQGTVAPKRMFPYDTPDALRLRILQVSDAAGLPFYPPGLIRKAALRDHPTSPEALGYLNQREYDIALKHAQSLADASR